MKITESQLRRIVKRMIREQATPPAPPVAGTGGMPAELGPDAGDIPPPGPGVTWLEFRGYGKIGGAMSYSQKHFDREFGDVTRVYSATPKEIRWYGARPTEPATVWAKNWPTYDDIEHLPRKEQEKVLQPWGYFLCEQRSADGRTLLLEKLDGGYRIFFYPDGSEWQTPTPKPEM